MSLRAILIAMNPLDKPSTLTQEDIELRLKELQYQSYLEQRQP